VTPCEEITADAVGLAALPADAPERARAEAHARTCAACARALADAARVLAALDAALPLPAPSAAALRLAAQPILAELDRRGARVAAVVGAAAAAWALPLALARRPVAGGRGLLVSAALAALAALATAVSVTAGGVAVVVFPVLSTAASLMAGQGGELRAGLGVHCALTELAAAVGAGAVALLVTRRAAGARSSTLIAAAGGGALAAQAALHETCLASTDLPHLMGFHTGPVVLALLLALAVTRVLAPIKPAFRP
jgi:hypothetical protein